MARQMTLEIDPLTALDVHCAVKMRRDKVWEYINRRNDTSEYYKRELARLDAFIEQFDRKRHEL